MIELNALIKKRKQLGMTRILLCRLTGYSKEWLIRVENAGERRVSPEFIEKYRNAVERYEKMLKGE